MSRPPHLGPPMPRAVSDLRRQCLLTVVSRASLDSEHVHLARVLFALTASTDPVVLAAIEAAIATAERNA